MRQILVTTALGRCAVTLLARLGRPGESAGAFHRAAALTEDVARRAWLASKGLEQTKRELAQRGAAGL